MRSSVTLSRGVLDMLKTQALLAVLALPFLSIVRIEKMLIAPTPMGLIGLVGYISIFSTNAMFLWQAYKTEKPASGGDADGPGST